jgi:hypothetical protein
LLLYTCRRRERISRVTDHSRPDNVVVCLAVAPLFFSYSDVFRTTRHNVFGHHHLCYRHIGCYHYLWLIRGRLIRRHEIFFSFSFFFFFVFCCCCCHLTFFVSNILIDSDFTLLLVASNRTRIPTGTGRSSRKCSRKSSRTNRPPRGRPLSMPSRPARQSCRRSLRTRRGRDGRGARH